MQVRQSNVTANVTNLRREDSVNADNMSLEKGTSTLLVTIISSYTIFFRRWTWVYFTDHVYFFWKLASSHDSSYAEDSNGVNHGASVSGIGQRESSSGGPVAFQQTALNELTQRFAPRKQVHDQVTVKHSPASSTPEVVHARSRETLDVVVDLKVMPKKFLRVTTIYEITTTLPDLFSRPTVNELLFVL